MIQNMVAPALRAPFKKPRPVVYPGSDGKPLAETETHFLAIAAFVALLRRFFANRSDVYAHGCNFIYYEEGNNKARFSPDAYVVFGVEKKNRRSYFLWEEKRAPAIVVEFTSRKTKNEDAIQKKELCARLGVKEYFMCDPKSEYLKPPLQGFRLADGRYEPIPMAADGSIHSVELRATLRLENKLLTIRYCCT